MINTTYFNHVEVKPTLLLIAERIGISRMAANKLNVQVSKG